MQRLDGQSPVNYISPFISLPTDLLRIITHFLTPQECFPLRFVSKKFSFIPTSAKQGLYKPGIVSGSLVYLNWIKLQNYPLKTTDYLLAAETGKIGLLQWLWENGVQWWPANILSVAVGEGHLEVVKWLREKGFSWDEWDFALAAQASHLNLLQWLKENGCPWNERCCSEAAGAGRIKILKWLRENGCPWDESACSRAALAGHLKTLKWLRENGCPWNEYSTSRAAWKGHLQLFKWLIENGCDWNKANCLSIGTENIKKWIVQSCKD